MGKPHIEAYLRFARRFYGITKEAGKEQYLVPYLMSSHPGSTLKDAVELALFLKREKIRPEQVQDFLSYPGHHFHLYVLHGAGSVYHEGSVRG